MQDSIFIVLWIGFLLGIKHATEADHLVAVTTIVSEQRSVWRSARVGALWGAGHTASLLIAGILVILLQVTIPERVASLLEFGVALMIIILGSRILFLVLRGRRDFHVHAHTHHGRPHTHIHFHDESDAHAVAKPHAHDGAPHGSLWGWRSFIVGMVHGLAGSAALTLLVLTEVVHGGSRLLGLAYLVIFGVGSVGGMLLMSTLISLPFVFTSARFERVNTPIRLVTGISSVAFGLYYAWATSSGLFQS